MKDLFRRSRYRDHTIPHDHIETNRQTDHGMIRPLRGMQEPGIAMTSIAISHQTTLLNWFNMFFIISFWLMTLDDHDVDLASMDQWLDDIHFDKRTERLPFPYNITVWCHANCLSPTAWMDWILEPWLRTPIMVVDVGSLVVSYMLSVDRSTNTAVERLNHRVGEHLFTAIEMCYPIVLFFKVNMTYSSIELDRSRCVLYNKTLIIVIDSLDRRRMIRRVQV